MEESVRLGIKYFELVESRSINVEASDTLGVPSPNRRNAFDLEDGSPLDAGEVALGEDRNELEIATASLHDQVGPQLIFCCFDFIDNGFNRNPLAVENALLQLIKRSQLPNGQPPRSEDLIATEPELVYVIPFEKGSLNA